MEWVCFWELSGLEKAAILGAAFLGSIFIVVGFIVTFRQGGPKHWTLSEIKERLEHESRIRIDLRGEAASFTIDKNFSGACATDLLASICEYYDPSKLHCEHPRPGTFTIATRP